MIYSIIIPTYNRSGFFDKPINSCLNQGIPESEIIVVDDGSTDDTEIVLRPFVQAGRILYFKLNNKGVSAARNFGASKASGRFLLFLDSDDDVSLTWLYDFNEVIKNNANLNLIFCNTKFVLADQENRIILPQQFSKLLPFKVNVSSGAFCISKQLFDRAGGYDAELRYSENTELFLRVLKLNPTVGYVNSANFIYNQSVDGGSKNIVSMMNAIKHILNKHKRYFAEDKDNKRVFLQKLGVICLKLGYKKNARHYLYKAYMLNPCQWKALLRLLVSYSPLLSRIVYAKIV